MEFVLRYAQRTMPGSQVGIVCYRSGSRYRWFALSALIVAGATGLAMFLRTGDADLAGRVGDPVMSLSDAYGRTLLALAITWAVLLAAVATMAFVLHPAQSRRSLPDASKAEVQQERERVGRAINRMNRVLRLELFASLAAVALGASLTAGGLA